MKKLESIRGFSIVTKETMDKLKREYPKKLYKQLKEKNETELDEERFINEINLGGLISDARNSQESAIEVLRLSVQFLKEADRGALSIPLPVYLGEYLGNAFEKALKEIEGSESKNKGKKLSKALSDSLHITTNHRRSSDAYEIGSYMLQYIQAGKSINEAALETAIAYKIDESTAKRQYKKMLSFFKLHPSSGV